MKNKIVVLIAIVLIFGAGVLPSISANTKLKNSFSPLTKGDIYVDDDFNESTPGWNVTHFNKIQDGIDAAVNFDNVYVYNGTYNENIRIGTLIQEKKITLIGEDRDSTIILGVPGEDAVVTVLSSDVEMNGFTVDGNSNELDGIRVTELKQDIVLTNNKIVDCARGILLLLTTKRVEISDSIILNSEVVGIELQESDQNDIINNDVLENKVGIQLTAASVQNSIEGNIVSNNNLEGITIGALSTDNTLVGNNITDNQIGIKLSASSQNIIESNNIQDNDMEGLLLTTLSNNNIIEKNNFIENKKNAVYKASKRNTWDENYWDDWIGLKIPIFQIFPKVIRGGIIFRLNFDRNPMLEPYVI
ncbi:MAG: right-handed parallel beta-helix repeat-containing protein [Thermoplasmatales archaeon]|nr:MAG: right-handed parallel beta-helix repeat-containing protein [Thermoplasmatales archaeon]